MIKRLNRTITVSGKEREINMVMLYELAQIHLPKGMLKDDIDRFVNEVSFRIADLESETEKIKGRSIEEYYFAACLAYVKENGLNAFLFEEDDGKVFDYCGSKLPMTTRN